MSEQSGDSQEAGILSPGRIEALTDGVFAIVMTLLVLELAVDTSAITSDEEFLDDLTHILSEVMSYIMTFIALGVFWIIHRYQFNFIRHADGVAIWLNIFFLTTVAIYPFTNSLLSYEGPVSMAIFTFNALVALLLLFGFWWYASSGNRLLKPNTSPRIVKLVRILPFPGIIGMTAAIPIAVFISYQVALFIMFFLLGLYVLLTALWSHKIHVIEVEGGKGAESE
jgi:uncharacterized membrane protein